MAPIPISFDVFISTSFLFLAGTPACKKHVRDTNSDPKPRRKHHYICADLGAHPADRALAAITARQIWCHASLSKVTV